MRGGVPPGLGGCPVDDTEKSGATQERAGLDGVWSSAKLGSLFSAAAISRGRRILLWIRAPPCGRLETT